MQVKSVIRARLFWFYIGLIITTTWVTSCGDKLLDPSGIDSMSTLHFFPGSLKDPVSVIEANDQRLVISVDATGLQTRSVEQGGTYTEIRIPGFDSWHERGAPALPYTTTFVRIPAGKTVSWSMLEEDIDQGFEVSSPVAFTRRWEIHSGKPLTVEKSEAAYRLPYGQAPVKIIDNSFAGWDRVATAHIFPVSYNAGRNEVVHRKRLKILFEFSSPKPSFNLTSDYFKPPVGAQTPSYIAPFLLNPRDSHTTVSSKKDLIVAHESFRGAIEAYLEFKKSIGRQVDLKFVNGQSADQIKALIKQEYASPTPPDHTLLVGNIDQIPSFRGSGDNTWTDFYYTTLDNGSIPDVSLGRIPAHNAAELQAFTSKVMAREQSSASNDNILITSGRDVGMGCPLNAKKVGQNITSSNSSMSLTNLSRSSGSSQEAIIEGYNSNPNIVVYDGHGYQQGMSEVPLLIRDLDRLKNRSFPIILDIACLNANWSRGANSRNFAEKVILNPNNGAAGIMAAGGSSGGHQFFQHIGSLIGQARAEIDNHSVSKYNEIGSIIMAAKAKANQSDKTYFNYYGDPATSVFVTKSSSTPQRITVAAQKGRRVLIAVPPQTTRVRACPMLSRSRCTEAGGWVLIQKVRSSANRDIYQLPEGLSFHIRGDNGASVLERAFAITD